KLGQVFLDTADLWLANNPQADPLTDPQFAALVAGFYRASGNAIQLRVITRKGELYRIPADGPVPRALVTDRDYFQVQDDAGRRGFYIGAPVVSREDGQWRIPVSLPLRRSGGEASVLLAAIAVDHFVRIFEEERVHPNGAVTLLRRDGTLLARAPHVPSLIGKSASSTDVFAQYLPRASRGVEFSDSSATDGLSKLTAYAALDDFPLVVIAAAAKDDILGRWKLDVSVIAVAGLLLTVFTLIACWRLIWLLREQGMARQELFRMATTDDLTGCLNRRHFMEALAREFSRSQRHGDPLSLMVLDLDFFKRINDGYGHAVGDKALAAFVAAARNCLRQSDLLARLGGEEFAILLPVTAIAQAQPVAERLREQVADIRIATPQGVVQFTVSIGIAAYGPQVMSAEDFLLRADRALYAAKGAGRNRVVQAPPEVSAEPVVLPG
ncbi:MAG TPA: sensor domain-containing diguanylate cyclase, partial [Azospira sp.]|nr:sensor domain-containing diguanylate cyclase [Azospira sp.]